MDKLSSIQDPQQIRTMNQGPSVYLPKDQYRRLMMRNRPKSDYDRQWKKVDLSKLGALKHTHRIHTTPHAYEFPVAQSPIVGPDGDTIMPAESKSQRRLFGMVRAYQKGALKNPPGKIKQVAKHVSPESADHYAKTKEDGLPDKVSEAFDRGFMKAAMEAGIEPLTAIGMLKKVAEIYLPPLPNLAKGLNLKAGPGPTLGAAQAGVSRYGSDLSTLGGIGGAGLGGLFGGGLGAGIGTLTTDDPEKKKKRALLGAGLGGIPGAMGGAMLGGVGMGNVAADNVAGEVSRMVDGTIANPTNPPKLSNQADGIIDTIKQEMMRRGVM